MHRSRAGVAGALLCCLTLGATAAQPIYQDLDKTFEARAADLVSRMTLEEKVAQLQNDAPAIPRLGVPAYEWWNEALHGVARAGAATVFPQAIGLAATFDVPLMSRVATAISDEARAKHHEFAGREQRRRYQGLTFWSPNINIFRDPRWGRGQETYGEDPHLTARMGVAFVKALQGDDPKYRKVDATAKHYVVHSGPEADRHVFDVHPSDRDLWETYMPAFQALVQEGKVASVMGAYNRVNGESASASHWLLTDILRKQWGFNGYVVSDCDSVEDVWKYHKIVATPEEAAALAVKSGDEVNCGRTYGALTNAVKTGLITEAEVDVAVRRAFLTRFQLGIFDPPERVKWARIPYSVNQSPAHDALARRAAQESIVLLKNDGVLPFDKAQLKSIAVIGPTADEIMSLLGNYYGTPAQPVTILQGIRDAVGPHTRVLYSRGADLVEGREEPRAAPLVEPQFLRPSADSKEEGLKGEYFANKELRGTPLLSRTDARVAFRWDRQAPTDTLVAQGQLAPEKGLPTDNFSVRWTGQLLPPVSGIYELVVGANDGFRLVVDGRTISEDWQLNPRVSSKSAMVELTSGKPVDIELEYFEDIRDAEVRLAWRLPGSKPPFEDALDAAKAAEVVVYVGGLTGDVEGEEMKVNYPGFAGGDRTDLRLPQSQQKLLEALHATGKPVVLVLTTGSAIAVDWAKDKLPAILVAWYPGQRGGTAVADVLFGAANPSGRLPVTFYKADEKLPDFADYSMKNRTYRYFEGSPLYAFGHGLSFTKFDYSGLKLDRNSVGAGGTATATVTVKNTGSRAGAEVAQLYLRPLDAKRTRALHELRGIERVELKPGESKRVTFTVKPARDLAVYDDMKKAYAVDPGRFEVGIGASSSDIRSRATLVVR
ncbi:MAG: glycoside hydrolase family 3 C-terminal domain-containing protein [Steroidobacteraceae bacterium]|nr:glycoside hydrolase family 3 C-terminal domain-containing protein [Steroidobacteraceae bacterium]